MDQGEFSLNGYNEKVELCILYSLFTFQTFLSRNNSIDNLIFRSEAWQDDLKRRAQYIAQHISYLSPSYIPEADFEATYIGFERVYQAIKSLQCGQHPSRDAIIMPKGDLLPSFPSPDEVLSYQLADADLRERLV